MDIYNSSLLNFFYYLLFWLSIQVVVVQLKWLRVWFHRGQLVELWWHPDTFVVEASFQNVPLSCLCRSHMDQEIIHRANVYQNVAVLPWNQLQQPSNFLKKKDHVIQKRSIQRQNHEEAKDVHQEEIILEKFCEDSTNPFLSSRRKNLLQMIVSSSTTTTIAAALFLQMTLEQSVEAYEEEYTNNKLLGKNMENGMGQDGQQQWKKDMSTTPQDSNQGIPLFEINDPNTYSGLVFVPASTNNDSDHKKKFPVLFVLHGAGENALDTWNLANIQGEHGGLAPSLLASKQAPKELYENFVVITPYSRGKASFYEEPRSKLLQFMDFSLSKYGGGAQGIHLDKIDMGCKFLFGFSDGATLGVELMTTGRFVAGVFCAYGFTGKLPSLALERLRGKPMWIFHSTDDGKLSV